MSPVSPGPRHPLGDGEHGLHGDDHPGPNHRVYVLPQLQPRLPPVVVTQHTETVAVAKRPGKTNSYSHTTFYLIFSSYANAEYVVTCI